MLQLTVAELKIIGLAIVKENCFRRFVNSTEINHIRQLTQAFFSLAFSCAYIENSHICATKYYLSNGNKSHRLLSKLSKFVWMFFFLLLGAFCIGHMTGAFEVFKFHYANTNYEPLAWKHWDNKLNALSNGDSSISHIMISHIKCEQRKK